MNETAGATSDDVAGTIQDIPAMRERITTALRGVYDPELGINIIDLGLVYGIEVDEKGQVLLIMTLTTPGCPMHESLANGVVAALEGIPGLTGGEVRLVWDPPWEPSRMTDAGRLALGGWEAGRSKSGRRKAHSRRTTPSRQA